MDAKLVDNILVKGNGSIRYSKSNSHKIESVTKGNILTLGEELDQKLIKCQSTSSSVKVQRDAIWLLWWLE